MIDNTNKSSKLGIEIRLAEPDEELNNLEGYENITVYEHYAYCNSIDNAIKILQQLKADEILYAQREKEENKNEV